MGWVRLEDTFCEHPKVETLADLPFRLHVKAICYANRNLTDGFIPAVAAAAMGGPRHKSATNALIAAGLWELARGGFRIHDYLDFQFSRDEVMAMRRSQERAGKVRASTAVRIGGRFAPAEHQRPAGLALVVNPPAEHQPTPTRTQVSKETGTGDPTPNEVDELLKRTHLGRMS